MSLFVGNVSKNVSLKDLEDEFNRFGTCKVNHRGSYAFIEYPDEQDAEDAIMVLNSKNMGGLCLNIEWSKRSTRYDPARSNRPAARMDRSKEKCYKCGQPGHISKDCRYALDREAPDCFECGGKGHIAKDCQARRHRSPQRRRSPSPKKSSSPRPRRRSSSERSFSLEHPGLIEAPSHLNITANPQEMKKSGNSQSDEEMEDDLVFPSDVKQPVSPVAAEPAPEDITETDGSKFVLVSPNPDPDCSGYRCENCSKTLQRLSIKKHITSKTHKERLLSK